MDLGKHVSHLSSAPEVGSPQFCKKIGFSTACIKSNILHNYLLIDITHIADLELEVYVAWSPDNESPPC